VVTNLTSRCGSGPHAKAFGGFSYLPGNVAGNKVLMQDLHTEQVIYAGIERSFG
jgi:hypothetical protein